MSLRVQVDALDIFGGDFFFACVEKVWPRSVCDAADDEEEWVVWVNWSADDAQTGGAGGSSL